MLSYLQISILFCPKDIKRVLRAWELRHEVCEGQRDDGDLVCGEEDAGEVWRRDECIELGPEADHATSVPRRTRVLHTAVATTHQYTSTWCIFYAWVSLSSKLYFSNILFFFIILSSHYFMSSWGPIKLLKIYNTLAK